MRLATDLKLVFYLQRWNRLGLIKQGRNYCTVWECQTVYHAPSAGTLCALSRPEAGCRTRCSVDSHRRDDDRCSHYDTKLGIHCTVVGDEISLIVLQNKLREYVFGTLIFHSTGECIEFFLFSISYPCVSAYASIVELQYVRCRKPVHSHFRKQLNIDKHYVKTTHHHVVLHVI